MAVRDVILDQDSMTVQVENGKAVVKHEIRYVDVEKIRFGEATVKRWFSSKQVKTVEIHVKDKAEPFVIRSDKLAASFRSVEDYMRKTADKLQWVVEEPPSG